MHAGHGGDGDQCVAQHVAQRDGQRVQALGDGGANKILLTHLEHGGPGQAREDRHVKAPMASAGSTRWRRVSNTRSSPLRPAPMLPLPPVGNQPSLTENSTMAIRPSQKPGVEYSSRASTDSTRSGQRPTRLAITVPSAIPRASARLSAASISSKVLPRRAPISSVTGRL